jgi:hypothetical protein
MKRPALLPGLILLGIPDLLELLNSGGLIISPSNHSN